MAVPAVVWHSNTQASMGFNANWHGPVAFGEMRVDANSTHKWISRIAGTFSSLRILVPTNSLAASLTFALSINLTDSALSITVGSGATGKFADTTHSATIASGDEVRWHGAVAGASGSMGCIYTSVVFTGSSARELRYSLAMIRGLNNTPSTTTYFGFGDTGDNGTTEALAQCRFMAPGTLKHFFVHINSNGKAGTMTLKTRVNGADGNLTVSIGSGATGTLEDNSHTDAIAAGDLVNLSVAADAVVGNDSVWSMSLGFTPSSGGYHLQVAAAVPATLAAGSTNYHPYGTRIAVTSSEGNARTPFQSTGRISKLRVVIGSNAATASSTVRHRINSLDGNLNVTIGAGATGVFLDDTDVDNVVDTDEALWLVVVGTGGALNLRGIHLLLDEIPVLTGAKIIFRNEAYV